MSAANDFACIELYGNNQRSEERTMPFYNVSVSAYCEVFVEAENEDEAQQRACEEVNYGDFEMDTGEPAQELKTAEEIDRYRRHANVKLDAV